MRVYTREMSAANWSDTEVLSLIELWGEDSIQQQLEGAKRNKHVYEKLARELQKTGSDKTSVCKRNKSDGVVRRHNGPVNPART